MESRSFLYVALLSLLLRLTSCHDHCEGPTAPAKFRAFHIANTNDDNPGDVQALATAYNKWMKSCRDLVVRGGHAPALTQDPELFGLKALPNSSYTGDFGGSSDWRSMEDLYACVAKGLKDGKLATMRRLAVHAARLEFPLNTKDGVAALIKGSKKCSHKSFAPAKVRLMIAYVLKDPSSVPTMVDLQSQLIAAAAVKPIRYGTAGKAALGQEVYMWGPGISKTADWGAWYDFASEADIRAFFAPTGPGTAAHALRTQLRAFSAGTVRVVIPLA